MTATDDVSIKQTVSKNGVNLVPGFTDLDLTSHTVSNFREVTVAADASDVTVPITTRGTIRSMIIVSDDTEVTVKVNGSAARKVSPMLRYDGNVTTLTHSNSDADNAKSYKVVLATA